MILQTNNFDIKILATGGAIRRHIGVAVSLILVEFDQLISFLRRKLAIPDPFHNGTPELVVELDRIKAYGTESIRERRSIYHLLYDVSVFADKNVGFVRNSEQVMVIPHNLLIGSDEHHRQIVRLVLHQLMQLENGLYIVKIDELVNNTVGIAGNVT